MTFTLKTRSDFGWGPTPASAASCNQGLVIHYDSVDRGLPAADHSTCTAYWKTTRDFHIKTRGWLDIGYSYGACPHGAIFEGRGFGRQQAAQPTGNTTWHSVTTMLGPSEDVTEAQRVAIIRLHDHLVTRGVGRSQKGHRDFSATACPGDRVYSMIKAGRFSPGSAPIREGQKMTPEEIATAVWDRRLPTPSGDLMTAAAHLRVLWAKAERSEGRVVSLAAQVGALQGAVAALATDGLTADELKAAAEAGATAALKELGDALMGGAGQ